MDLEQQVIDYQVTDSTEIFEFYCNAIKCWYQHEDDAKYTVRQILNKFAGSYQTRDEFIEKFLIANGIEDKLHDIKIPTPPYSRDNPGFPMFLECLDYDKVWETMSQMDSSLRAYKWDDENDPQADHKTYLFNITR